jgi:hypothetical protein
VLQSQVGFRHHLVLQYDDRPGCVPVAGPQVVDASNPKTAEIWLDSRIQYRMLVSGDFFAKLTCEKI